MKKRILSIFLAVLLIANLSSCTFLKGFFSKPSVSSSVSSDSVKSEEPLAESIKPVESEQSSAVLSSETASKAVSSKSTVVKEEAKVAYEKEKEDIIDTEITPLKINSSFPKLQNRKCYNSLDSDQKVLYNDVLKASKRLTKTVDCKKLSDDKKYIQVITAVRYDNPEIFWIDSYMYYGYTSSGAWITICYMLDTVDLEKNASKANKQKGISEINAKNAKLEQEINGFLSGISNDMSQYELELALHDQLVLSCSYDSDVLKDNKANLDAWNIYGAFIKKKAVCEGYAKAMQLLLSYAGIESALVCGEGSADGVTRPHMWNIVLLGTDWYYLDATWNDPSGNSKNHISYDYFNISTKELERDHYLKDNIFTPPSCTASSENYFIKEGLLFSLYDSDASQKTAAHFNSLLAKGRGSISIKYSGDDFDKFSEDAQKDFAKIALTASISLLTLSFSYSEELKIISFYF